MSSTSVSPSYYTKLKCYVRVIGGQNFRMIPNSLVKLWVAKYVHVAEKAIRPLFADWVTNASTEIQQTLLK